MTQRRSKDVSLLDEAVSVMARAAQRSTSRYDLMDFAGFLAQVLAATAANVGGPCCLLAGRPGSWEASQVQALLQGTMGDEPDDWSKYRTEPVIVPLCVAELIESGDLHPGLFGLDDAIDAAGAPYESAGDDEEVLDAWDAEIESLTERYKAEYVSYADRFTTAAQAAGKALGIQVEVVVVADVDPISPSWSESTTLIEVNDDDLAFRIWSAAHDAVALPNVEIRLMSHAEQHIANAGR